MKRKHAIGYLAILFLLMNCELENCNCDFRVDVQNESTHLLDSLVGLSEGNEFWERYEEKKLSAYHGNGYRVFEQDWMREITRIYRVSETETGFQLIHKEYKDGQSVNQFDYLDSLVVYVQIPLSQKEMEAIHSLFEQNCFWTHPFKRPGERPNLHPKHYFIEAFAEKGNRCTKRNYHFVDMLRYPHAKFEVILEKLEYIGRNYGKSAKKDPF